MAQWSEDIGNILGGLFGNNGAGDDIANVIMASNMSRNNMWNPAMSMNPYAMRPVQPIPWGMVILALAGVALLFLFFKK